jgi:pimeloyl-ACP methyl ester carboxylesterase
LSRGAPHWNAQALALLAAGCIGFHGGPARGAAPPAAPASRSDVLLIVPGAGGFSALCRMFHRALDDDHLSLTVEQFTWTHGFLRILADHLDSGHAREQARRLAERVLALREECPGRAVYLVSHSAGCGVLLEAAAQLPPNSVDRIVLLAPAVSAAYDLRPALACSVQGIDVFYSKRDWATLGIGIALLGTADRHWSPPAGRVGFRPVLCEPGDECLFAKLRQHPWDPSLSKIGNAGGHYGTYQPAFLQAYLLPLLLSGDAGLPPSCLTPPPVRQAGPPGPRCPG